MEIFSTAIPYLFLAFCFCLFSMRRHLASFRGSSQIFHFILMLDVTICILGAIAFLVCLGIEVSWWVPIVCGVAGSIIAGIAHGFISMVIPEIILSLTSMLAAPTLLVVMLVSLYGSDAPSGDGVYICTGRSSQVYHKTTRCRGLEACDNSIERVSFDKAKALYRRPCKVCKPKN